MGIFSSLMHGMNEHQHESQDHSSQNPIEAIL